MQEETFAKSEQLRKVIAGLAATLSSGIIALRDIEKHFHLPDFLLVGLGFLVFGVFWTVYGVIVWSEAAAAREALQKKYDEADRLLFGEAASRTPGRY